jgi:hypothetical protein
MRLHLTNIANNSFKNINKKYKVKFVESKTQHLKKELNGFFECETNILKVILPI